jgi:hypothetical protein
MDTMEVELDHLSLTRVSPTVSKQSRAIGVKVSANGKQLPKLHLQSSQPLLARMTNNEQLPETPTSPCLTSTTAYSPKLVPEDSKTVSKILDSTKGTRFPRKTLMERLGLNNCIPEVHHLSSSGANLTSPFIPGRSKRKSPLSLFQRILSTPAPWFKTTPLTSNTPSGPCSPQDHYCHSPNPSGRTSFLERQSTLTPSSQDFSPPLLMTRLPPPLETLISPSVVASHPKSYSPMVTGPSPGMLQPLQSSVPSLTVPVSCSGMLNTSFSFSEPFLSLTQKSSISTKPSAVMQEKLSTLNCLSSVDSGTSKLVTSKTMAPVTVVSSLKRKRSLGLTGSPMMPATSGTAESVTGKLQNANIATYVPTVRESIPKWSVRRRIETSREYMRPRFARDLIWGDTTNTISPSAQYSLFADPLPCNLNLKIAPPSILFVTTQIYSKLYIISISRSFPSFL